MIELTASKNTRTFLQEDTVGPVFGLPVIGSALIASPQETANCSQHFLMIYGAFITV